MKTGVFVAVLFGVCALGTPAQESRPADPVSEEIQRLAQAGRLAEAVDALDALIAKGSKDARHHAARFSFLGALYKQDDVVHRPRLAAAARSYAALLPEGESRTQLRNLAAKLEEADRGVDSAPASRPQKAGLTGMQRIELASAEAELTAAAAETTREKQLAGFRAALERLKPLVEAVPDEVNAWRLLAIAASQLDDEDEGRRAAQALMRFGAVESDDVRLQKVMVALNLKGWLKEGPKIDVEAVASWADVVVKRADPQAVTDAKVRERIAATGLPWLVKHRATGIEFVLIPPGEYLRGAPDSDDQASSAERPQHRIVIGEPFYLARTELTNAQYRRFRPAHSSGTFGEFDLNGETQPVVNVNWNDATSYCKEYGFELLSEAQWEYAARAGTTTRYPWGDDPDAGKGWANGCDASAKRKWPEWSAFSWDDGYPATAPVGLFPNKVVGRNAFGLFDMIGNVWEWCATVYDAGEYARCKTKADGRADAPTTDGPRVLRGGSWFFGPRFCRSSSRFRFVPSFTYGYVGFRPARTCR